MQLEKIGTFDIPVEVSQLVVIDLVVGHQLFEGDYDLSGFHRCEAQLSERFSR
jgi:hypothetical protein